MRTDTGCIGYHCDDAARRHAEKFQQWSECLHNIVNSVVRIGSRMTVRENPIFLTPEVLPGGFASGRLSAGGDLAPFEQELVDKNHLDVSASSSDYKVQLHNVRKSLNKYFLSPKGLEELYDLLKSGRYHCLHPEEAALLVMVWMLERGDVQLARGLVSTIAPYFGDVRFYPHLSSAPQSLDLKCSLLTVGAFKRRISDMGVSKGSLTYAVNKLIVEDLAPSYDMLISLILATYKKGAFDLLPFEVRPSNNMVAAFKTLFRHFEKVQGVYDAILHLAKQPRKELKQLGQSRNCGKLLRIAKAFVESKKRRVMRIERTYTQKILNQIRFISRRGLPSVWTPGDSFRNGRLSLNELPPKLKSFRERQRRTTQAEHKLVSQDWKKLSMARISKMSTDDQTGIDDVRPLTQPVAETEAELYGMKRGADVPSSILRMAEMLQKRTLNAMFEKELVPSMDVMAILLDQILGAAKAQCHGPVEMRRLYVSLIGAFRRRRSVLLQNYKAQVSVDQLPWFHRLEEVQRENADVNNRGNSELFCELVRICISKWPDVMMPNKMVTALDQIARDFSVSTAQGSWIGLLPELAADIFMGEFTSKWCLHAALTKNMMTSSLYGKYYGTGKRKSLWDGIEELQFDSRLDCDQFASLCTKRASQREVHGSSARNGAIIEESMILTGQNYPYLLQMLVFHGKRFESKEFLEICFRCFEHLKKTLIPALDKKTPWQTRKQITKNVAYGWRQLVILVSSMNCREVEHFFRHTVSLQEAIGGCTLQRALVDLRAVWMAMQNEGWTGRSWKPLRGWHSGEHALWDKSWCERLKSRAHPSYDRAVLRGD
ncbi:FHA domain containing protein [Gracilaria domingensis]|nr:FHA domain containing protein [Gracilaria domingensis]